MATKRKADEIPSDTEAVELYYSPNFPLYDGADLVIQSRDGVLFATRALHLRAASSVFDDILSLPPREEQEKKDGLLLLKIEEDSSLFAFLLRYIHPEKLFVDGQLPTATWSTILLLSKLFDKYHTPLLSRLILLEHLPRFIQDPLVPKEARGNTSTNLPNAIGVFAIATIHGLEDLARRALKWNHAFMVHEKGARTMSHDDGTDKKKVWLDRRPSGIGDLSLDLLSRMSSKVVRDFSALRQKVLLVPDYSWIKAGDDFKVRFVVLFPRDSTARFSTSTPAELLLVLLSTQLQACESKAQFQPLKMRWSRP